MYRLCVFLSILTFLGGCNSAKSDFESFCPKLQEFLSSPEFQNATAPNKPSLVAGWVEKTFTSRPMRLTMGALASASPKEKYRLFQAAASEVGVPNFECAEWEELIGPTPGTELGSLCFAFGEAKSKLEGKVGAEKDAVLKAFFDEALSKTIEKNVLKNPMSAPPEGRWSQLLDVGEKHTGSKLSCPQLEAALKPEPPKPELPPPDAKKGCRTKPSIQKTIRTSMKKIRFCYEKELMKKPSLEGKLVAEFTINPDGAVSVVKVPTNSVSPTVGSCVEKVMMRLRFKGEDECNGYTTVKYPFIFHSK